MKTHETGNHASGKPRISLEQKIRKLLRRFRATERRHHHLDPAPPPRSRHRHFHIFASIIVLFALGIFSYTSRAETTAGTFDQANATFASGNYPAAIKQYSAILAQSGWSAPVLFNLGNACYRNGQFGEAILNFERAKVLAPHDGAIQSNLQLARDRAGVRVPALNKIDAVARTFTPNALAWTGNIALVMICLMLGASPFGVRFARNKAVLGMAVALLVVVVMCLVIRWPDFNRAIVITSQAPARIAPADTAAASFKLNAGEPITVARHYGQFVLGRTTDDRAGWLRDSDIGVVYAARGQ